MFEDAEGDVDELAHDRADDAHFWFSSGTKSGSEVLQWGVMFDGHKSRHVEGLAQVAVAFFAQASVATHRAAALFALMSLQHGNRPSRKWRNCRPWYVAAKSSLSCCREKRTAWKGWLLMCAPL